MGKNPNERFSRKQLKLFCGLRGIVYGFDPLGVVLWCVFHTAAVFLSGSFLALGVALRVII